MDQTPRITVIFLLYNAARTVRMLVDAISTQKHPAFAKQSDWLEVIFMDDHSPDDTVKILYAALAEKGYPAHYKVVVNESNLGLSRTLNKAFRMAKAPLGLTCHCDCIFGSEGYVAGMLDLLERHPGAGAISGQPLVRSQKELPLIEKLNVVANLQDIFPASDPRELVLTGFAEGRCDGFRIQALAAVGFYDEGLRLAGEDQVIAARMRGQGYAVYQAPRLTYFLSVSDEQDNLRKLVRHQRLYGRAHPYIVIKNRGTSKGLVGPQAGPNRSSRTVLRTSQLVATVGYLLSIGWILSGFPAWSWLLTLAGIFLIKAAIFSRHIRAVTLSIAELALFCVMQPFLDFSYSLGLVQGLWQVVRRTDSRPIS